MEKILSLLTRISELYTIPQWIVNSGAIAICIILVAFPFIARYLMRPKYSKFRELILFKVLWRWKYKKGDIVGLWCYCPKCQSILMVDDENCRSEETLQHKVTYFICQECGGNELGRVVGGDRRYVLSLVRRDIWRHIRDGSYNEVSSATKGALELYAQFEEAKVDDVQIPLVSEENVALTTSETDSSTTSEEESVDETQEDEKEAEESLHVNESEAIEITIPAQEELQEAESNTVKTDVPSEEIKKDGI